MPLTTSDVSKLVWVAVVHQWPCWQHLACCSINTGSQARYRLRIAISAYTTCIRRPRYGGSHRNIAMPFGTEKLEWRGYPIVKKFWWYVYSFWHNSRTWQMDGQTDRHSMTTRLRLHSIARQKWNKNRLTKTELHFWQTTSLTATDVSQSLPFPQFHWAARLVLQTTLNPCVGDTDPKQQRFVYM